MNTSENRSDIQTRTLSKIGTKLRSALAAMGFVAPAVAVTLHDTEINPLVAKAGGPVIVVGIGAAAPADIVEQAAEEN